MIFYGYLTIVYIVHLEKCLIASPRPVLYSKRDTTKVGNP